MKILSKYTTEVRYICETKSGLSESTGFSNVDEVLENSWNQIFTTKCEFFEESYRPILCKKILKHYYTREIGAETVGLWSLWMNTKLEEIMPYYNNIYKTTLLEFSPIEDVNYTRTYVRTNDDKSEGSGSDTTNTNNTVNMTNRNLYSDTPQGALTGVETETYLTNATKITDNGTNNTDSTTTRTTNVQDNKKENFGETIKGKQGTTPFSQLIKDYIENLVNIDLKVIDEFSDLFMGLW